MAISTQISSRVDRGTVFGVPFIFDFIECLYKLPDGKTFSADKEGEREMTEYVIKNLKSYERYVFGHNALPESTRAAAEKIIQDEILKSITNQNPQPQKTITADELIESMTRKLEGELNKKIVAFVKMVMENGPTVVARIPELVTTWRIDGGSNTVVGQYENIVVEYDKTLPPDKAYMKLRNRIEQILRQAEKTPNSLHVMPIIS